MSWTRGKLAEVAEIVLQELGPEGMEVHQELGLMPLPPSPTLFGGNFAARRLVSSGTQRSVSAATQCADNARDQDRDIKRPHRRLETGADARKGSDGETSP